MHVMDAYIKGKSEIRRVNLEKNCAILDGNISRGYESEKTSMQSMLGTL